MNETRKHSLLGYFWYVCAATFLAAVCPVVAAWALDVTGVIRSAPASVAVGTALSLVAAYTGGRYWSSRPESGDVLFGDLMLWGWLRRLWTERTLRSSVSLLRGIDEVSGHARAQKEGLLLDLVHALERGDPYTSGHSRRVARHAEMMAKALGLGAREVAKVRTAATLHDVGKVHTPKAILHKAGRLSDEEFDAIKRHPVDGAAMVAQLGDAELTAIVRHHHERLDGTGYPDRLLGDEIPLGARIIAVADTFDAITSVRPYRSAKAHKRALDILASEAGTQLDPTVVRAFQRYYTGSRPLAAWVTLGGGLQRLSSLLGGGVSSATTSLSRVALAVGATGASAVVVSAPVVSAPHRAAPPWTPNGGVVASAGSPVNGVSAPIVAAQELVLGRGVPEPASATGRSVAGQPRVAGASVSRRGSAQVTGLGGSSAGTVATASTAGLTTRASPPASISSTVSHASGVPARMPTTASVATAGSDPLASMPSSVAPPAPRGGRGGSGRPSGRGLPSGPDRSIARGLSGLPGLPARGSGGGEPTPAAGLGDPGGLGGAGGFGGPDAPGGPGAAGRLSEATGLV